MNVPTVWRLDRLPIPPSIAESARSLARVGAGLLGDTCIVLLADGATLVPVAVHDRDPDEIERVNEWLSAVPLECFALVRNVLASGEPAVGEVDEVRASRGEPMLLGGTGLHSFLVVPLHPLIGVVVFARRDAERSRFHGEHVALAVELADVVASEFDLGAGLGTGLLN
jgi:GAF domain-containing protein